MHVHPGDPSGIPDERKSVVEILGQLRIDGEGEELPQVDAVGVAHVMQGRGLGGVGGDGLAEAPADTAVGEEGLHDVLENAALAQWADDPGAEAQREGEKDELPGVRLDRRPFDRQRRPRLEQRLHFQALALGARSLPRWRKSDRRGRRPGSDRLGPGSRGGGRSGCALWFAGPSRRPRTRSGPAATRS